MTTENMPENMRKDVSLKQYSTFKIGGEAKYFSTVHDEEEARRNLDFAVLNKLRVFVIGKGSNLLISDKGFDGLVLKIEDDRTSRQEIGEEIEVRSGAGSYITKLALDFQKDGIGGLEWGAGIPATLGGAICNNAGANGKDISESIKTVKIIEMKFHEDGKYLESYSFREMTKDECAFGYRKSIFKEKKNFVILSATLILRKGDSANIQQEIAKNLENRRLKQPLEYPNVGSIFKNPVISEEKKNKLSEKCPQMENICKNGILPAGWLIEQVGLKGKKIGGAMVSEKHANFIINAADAEAEDVAILISLIKQKVRIKFGIQLHEEIEYVGF